MNKTVKILGIVVLVLVVLVLVLGFIKDQVVSDQLSKNLKMPVTVRGISFMKVFQKNFSELSLGLLAVGEGESKISFENIRIDNIRKNANQPGFCLDGKIIAKRIFMGASSHSYCSGGLDFYCVPYLVSDKETAITLKNIKVNLGKSLLSSQGSVYVNPKTETTRVDLSGDLSRGKINETLSCLNSESDEIDSEFEVPHFYGTVTVKDAADPLDTINTMKASGNFNLYQGKIKALNIIEKVLDSFDTNVDKEGTDEGDKFLKVNSNFSVADAKLNLTNLSMQGSSYSVSGQGSIGMIDEKLNFSVWLSGLNNFVSSSSLKYLPRQGSIPVKITGTIEKPDVKPDVAAAVKEAAKEEMINQANKLIDKGLGKLFNKE